MKKALILDGYGTLFFTGTGSVDAAGKVLAKRGRFDLDAKEFYARWKQIHRQHLEAPGTFLTEEVLYHRDLRELYAEYAIEGDPDEDVQIMLCLLYTSAGLYCGCGAVRKYGDGAVLPAGA